MPSLAETLKADLFDKGPEAWEAVIYEGANNGSHVTHFQQAHQCQLRLPNGERPEPDACYTAVQTALAAGRIAHPLTIEYSKDSGVVTVIVNSGDHARAFGLEAPEPKHKTKLISDEEMAARRAPDVWR